MCKKEEDQELLLIQQAMFEHVNDWPVSYYLGKDPAKEEAEVNALAEECE